MKTKLLMAMVFLVSLMALGALTPAAATAGQKSIVGSWIVDGTPDPPGPTPFRALATFTPDGLLVQCDPQLGTGARGLETRVRPRADEHVRHPDPPGHPLGQGTITVTTTGTVDQEWTRRRQRS